MSGVSPWAAALGERVDDLDPRLRDYFSTIPAGQVGRGEGVFDRVGTPRRWLWPVLAILGRAGVLFPVWQRDVPFTVQNTPADGAVRAERTFRFPSGERVMRDEVRFTRDGLVDVLGTRQRLHVALTASVVDGRLELRSRRARLRIGPVLLPIPLAPRVRLVERREGERQHVALTMTMPLVGRIYEYAGSFDYRIESA